MTHDAQQAAAPEAERQWWADQVAVVGKFHGEAPWVPYLWDRGLNGWAGDEIVLAGGRAWVFVIDAAAQALWPELVIGQVVALRERDDGTVVEVDT